jgi:hypothetical protein
LYGANNGATGRFWIDEIYAVRPGNTPSVREELLYGLNETNPDNDAPLGWENRDGDPPILDGAFVEPTEGTDYMAIPITGNWMRNAQSIDSGQDFDEWEKVVDITADIRMSDDFGGTWQNLILEVSSSGGSTQYPFKNTGQKDSWKTVTWDVDMSQHLAAIANGDPLKLIFITNNAADTGGLILIDNIRVGVATTFVLANRSISSSAFQGGETFDVTISIEAEGDSQDYELIEILPEGWIASNISDGGTEPMEQ